MLEVVQNSENHQNKDVTMPPVACFLCNSWGSFGGNRTRVPFSAFYIAPNHNFYFLSEVMSASQRETA